MIAFSSYAVTQHTGAKMHKLFHYAAKVAVLATRTTLLPMSWRPKVLRLFGIQIGEASRLRHGVLFGSHRISLGNNVGINVGCFLDGSNAITIEDNVSLGPYVKIITGSHEVGPSTQRCFGPRTKPVRIEKGSWLNAGCTILPGVTVARGCVIGAGAVVTKCTEPNGFYAGVPAVRIKDLY